MTLANLGFSKRWPPVEGDLDLTGGGVLDETAPMFQPINAPRGRIAQLAENDTNVADGSQNDAGSAVEGEAFPSSQDDFAPEENVATQKPKQRPFPLSLYDHPPVDFLEPCDRGAQLKVCEGWVPKFFEDRPWHYKPTPEDLELLPDQQKKKYAGFYNGAANAAEIFDTVVSAARGVSTVRRGVDGNRLPKLPVINSKPTFRDISNAYRDGMVGSKQEPEP